jgi:hypothetical protein
MTAELWSLAGVAVLAGALCIWAWATGKPEFPQGMHRDWGQTRNLAGRVPPWGLEPDQPEPRWYDENPWPMDGPHGWGETHD